MRRRDFIAALGSAAAMPLTANAQQLPLIGFIHAGSAVSVKEQYEAFLGGMTSFGYSQGRNVRYESRFADGQIDRLSSLANEILRLNPALIVSAPLPANIAVKKASTRFPL